MSDSQAQHTALPWRREHFDSPLGDTGDYSHCDRILTSNGRIVFDIWDREESCDDAERVLRAVNAHEQLVEALRVVLSVADEETNWRKDGEMLREGTRYGVYLKAETLEQIDAALRAAMEEVDGGR